MGSYIFFYSFTHRSLDRNGNSRNALSVYVLRDGQMLIAAKLSRVSTMADESSVRAAVAQCLLRHGGLGKDSAYEAAQAATLVRLPERDPARCWSHGMRADREEYLRAS